MIIYHQFRALIIEQPEPDHQGDALHTMLIIHRNHERVYVYEDCYFKNHEAKMTEAMRLIRLLMNDIIDGAPMRPLSWSYQSAKRRFLNDDAKDLLAVTLPMIEE